MQKGRVADEVQRCNGAGAGVHVQESGVQRCRGGADMQACRGSEEVVQRWRRVAELQGAGAEVLLRCSGGCRGGADVVQR